MPGSSPDAVISIVASGVPQLDTPQTGHEDPLRDSDTTSSSGVRGNVNTSLGLQPDEDKALHPCSCDHPDDHRHELRERESIREPHTWS